MKLSKRLVGVEDRRPFEWFGMEIHLAWLDQKNSYLFMLTIVYTRVGHQSLAIFS